MTRLYSGENFLGPVCEAAAHHFNGTLDALYAQGKRVVRVLEVGAGKLTIKYIKFH